MAQILNNTYEILDFIGKGGMSTVFKARHIRLDMEVAIKAVHKDRNINLLAEVSILKKLSHPNLVRVIDIFEDEKLVYIVMDYIEGEDLQHVIQREKVIPEDKIVEWFKTLTDALCYLHSRKPPVIYRDMKPANVMLQKDGTLKIIDFGIAREYDALATRDTFYIGTNGFAAPEQFGRAQSDGRTDIYSLGMTMYYLATGKNPLDPPFGYIPARQVNPHLSRKLEKILDKCLKYNPDERYQSADALLKELNSIDISKLNTSAAAGYKSRNNYEGYAETEATAELITTTKPLQTAPVKKSGAALIGIILCAAALVISGLFFLFPRGTSDPDQHISPADPPAETDAAAADSPAEPPHDDQEAEGGSDPGNEVEEDIYINDTPLVYAAAPFSGTFSPFFAKTEGDRSVNDITQLSLISFDRQGAVIEKGISGEVRNFRGTNYTYYSPADLTISDNGDGTVDYTFKLREDLTFSDGDNITADDIIFSMYVLSDPAYDGSSSFRSLPVIGAEEYRQGMSSLLSMLTEAGRNNTNFELWDRETQTAFWADLETAGNAFVQEILDYVVENEYCNAGDSVAAKMAVWGYTVPAGASNFDIFMTMLRSYGYDLITMTNTEYAKSSLDELMPNYSEYAVDIRTGESADSISGITKVDDYTVRIRLADPDASDIYCFDIPIAPLHYYGDSAAYSYEGNMFGFAKGDLNHIRSVSGRPLGAGPYKFIRYENDTVYFEANDGFYKGEPKIKDVSFIESDSSQYLSDVTAGNADIAYLPYTYAEVMKIQEANGGEISGPELAAVTYESESCGYIGIAADKVNVAGEPDSEKSRNLRKAFATIFSVYRDNSIESYFGKRASVLNYPDFAASWESPQFTDKTYSAAFSVKPDGSMIYASGLSEAERITAASEAAAEFFRAAGCAVEDGKVTAAPEGVPVNSKGQIEYEVGIPGDGSGDHPSFILMMLAKNALASMNVSLVITDFSDPSDLYERLKAGELPIWCFSRDAKIDSNIRDIYYSSTVNGEKNIDISNADLYALRDAELERLTLKAEKSTDLNERRFLYQSAFDIIMDWAVEVPVYQKKECTVINPKRINIDSIALDITAYYSWMDEIENIIMR